MENFKKIFNEVVGITEDNEIYLLNYVFDHGNYKGATGSVLIPVSQDEIDERNDLETVKDIYGYLWQEAVASNSTELGFDEYMQSMIDEECRYSEGYYIGHDTSDIHHLPSEFTEKYFPNAETYECIGGGRCFGRNIKWKTIINPELVDLINDFEEEKILPPKLTRVK